MFERQTRSSFPATTIMVLALVVVAFLVYILKSVPPPAPAPPPPDTMVPAADSGRIEVQIDSVVR